MSLTLILKVTKAPKMIKSNNLNKAKKLRTKMRDKPKIKIPDLKVKYLFKDKA